MEPSESVKIMLLAKPKPDAYVISLAEKQKLDADKTSIRTAQFISCAAKRLYKYCIKSMNATLKK